MSTNCDVSAFFKIGAKDRVLKLIRTNIESIDELWGKIRKSFSFVRIRAFSGERRERWS